MNQPQLTQPALKSPFRLRRRAISTWKRIALAWTGAVLAIVSVALAAPMAVAENTIHDEWSQLLEQCVVTVNKGNSTAADYDCFDSQRSELKAYLNHLEAVSARSYSEWDSNDQLAFLINAYNAWTVELILTEWPDLESIKDLGTFLRSPWKKSFIPLLGETLSLDDIEHGMIREPGRFDDPRIHFAVNCASIGCPALRQEAYLGVNLDTQLDEQTSSFLADSSRNRFDNKRLYLSSLFKWYQDDFESGWRGADTLHAFIELYEDALNLPEEVSAVNQLVIEYLDYDWRLNKP